jgi:preprotein translocase subunit Sss1
MDEKEFKKILLDLRKNSEIEFYKLIIYIASGGLILTISFSDKIVGIDKTRQNIEWLIATWIFFATTIFICLLFHFISVIAIDYYLSDEVKLSSRWNKILKYLQLTSIFILLLGMLSFIIYTILSLKLIH